ncbi:hypothetical protein PG997_011105 [Apiospora hydei]|uniref:Uncharacterized protein n=1 Tax=Apiospora hydei TaxID=1337664 RepID=A0ABR1VID5_9PEZI
MKGIRACLGRRRQTWQCASFAVEEYQTPRAAVLVYEDGDSVRYSHIRGGCCVYIPQNGQGLFAFGGAVPLRADVTGFGKVERCKTFGHHGWTALARIVHTQKHTEASWWNGREMRNSASHELGQSQARTACTSAISQLAVKTSVKSNVKQAEGMAWLSNENTKADKLLSCASERTPSRVWRSCLLHPISGAIMVLIWGLVLRMAWHGREEALGFDSILLAVHRLSSAVWKAGRQKAAADSPKPRVGVNEAAPPQLQFQDQPRQTRMPSNHGLLPVPGKFLHLHGQEILELDPAFSASRLMCPRLGLQHQHE